MLTNERAFAGDDVTETLANVMAREPNWALCAPSAVPVMSLVQRCLAKSPKQRLRDIGDVTLWLDDVGRVSPASQVRPSRLAAWTTSSAIVGAIAGGAFIALQYRTHVVPSTVSRFEVAAPATDQFDAGAFGSNVAISPDGTRIILTAKRGGVSELVLRRLDQLAPVVISGTEGAFDPFFSADGLQVGFATTTELRRVPIDGGPVASVSKISQVFNGATWGADDTIVFGQLGRIFRVRASGGEPEEMASPDPAKDEAFYTNPRLSRTVCCCTASDCETGRHVWWRGQTSATERRPH